MTPRQKSNTKQVSQLGESPAEARAKMQSSGGAEVQTQPDAIGEEVKGPLKPEHMKAIRAVEEGFGGGPIEGGTVEEAGDAIEAPSPTKAIETIRQLSQDKMQLLTERDSALNLVEQYRARFGELD